MLKRSHRDVDLPSLVPPQFCAASEAKRSRARAASSSAGTASLRRRQSSTWDAALLSAYMVEADAPRGPTAGLGMGLEILNEPPKWSGSWASHGDYMRFIFGGDQKPPDNNNTAPTDAEGGGAAAMDVGGGTTIEPAAAVSRGDPRSDETSPRPLERSSKRQRLAGLADADAAMMDPAEPPAEGGHHPSWAARPSLVVHGSSSSSDAHLARVAALPENAVEDDDDPSHRPHHRRRTPPGGAAHYDERGRLLPPQGSSSSAPSAAAAAMEVQQGGVPRWQAPPAAPVDEDEELSDAPSVGAYDSSPSDVDLVDEADAAAIDRASRAVAAKKPLRRGFFANALKRRLEALRDENARLKRLASDVLDDTECVALFADLGTEHNSAIDDDDAATARGGRGAAASSSSLALAASAASSSSSLPGAAASAIESERTGNLPRNLSSDSTDGARQALEQVVATTNRVVANAAQVDRRDLTLVKVVQQAQRAFVVTNPALPDNPIVWSSDEFGKLTGYSREEVCGRNCRFLQGPRTNPKSVEAVRRAIRDKYEASVVLLNYRKDGSTFWNRFFIAPLRDARGRITFFVGVQTDVSSKVSSSSPAGTGGGGVTTASAAAPLGPTPMATTTTTSTLTAAATTTPSTATTTTAPRPRGGGVPPTVDEDDARRQRQRRVAPAPRVIGSSRGPPASAASDVNVGGARPALVAARPVLAAPPPLRHAVGAADRILR